MRHIELATKLAARVLPVLLLLPLGAAAQTSPVIEADRWQVHGARGNLVRDGRVVGGGATEVASPTEAREVWSSGAGVPIPIALAAGERVTGVFWARAARPTRIPVTLQGGAPDHRTFAVAEVELTPAWRCYAITGAAPTALAAGSQSLTVQLGKAATGAVLGPVTFLRGRTVAAQIEHAFDAYRPAQVAEDVLIASDPGVTLAGTLRTPGRAGPGPHPVAILLAGSGRSPRGIFPLLERRLLAAGVATLSFDKRGVGRSTGRFADLIEPMQRDAAASVAYVRKRADIDMGRIAIVGLSQGGVTGPAIAAGGSGIAALVMLAGPAGSQGALFLGEMRVKLLAAGMREDAAERVVAATRLFMDAQTASASGSMIPPARKKLVTAFASAG